VIGIQTFTKVLAPGCRVGWVVAQPAFIEKLTFATDGTTSNPSGFAEAVLSQVLLRQWGMGGFVRWIEGLKVNYQSRRDLLCEALAEGRDAVVCVQRHEMHTTYENDSSRSKKRKSHSISKDSVVEKHTKVRLYDFRVPPAGFYVWVAINVSSHPSYHQTSSKAIVLKLWKHLVSDPYNIFTLPGSIFGATPELEEKSNELRLTLLRYKWIS